MTNPRMFLKSNNKSSGECYLWDCLPAVLC